MAEMVSNVRDVKAASQETGRRYKVDVGRASEGAVDVGFEFGQQMQMSVWSVGQYGTS